MWHALPTLAALSPLVCGPFVGARQPGLEHKSPTRSPSLRIVSPEKASLMFESSVYTMDGRDRERRALHAGPADRARRSARRRRYELARFWSAGRPKRL